MPSIGTFKKRSDMSLADIRDYDEREEERLKQAWDNRMAKVRKLSPEQQESIRKRLPPIKVLTDFGAWVTALDKELADSEI